MEILEIFQVLGIEATKDEQAIRNAYRDKLSVTNPEDNPEGFKGCAQLMKKHASMQSRRMKLPKKKRTPRLRVSGSLRWKTSIRISIPGRI